MIRKFTASAQQLMEPMLKVGKAGLSEGFIRTVSETLDKHELVKIKFMDFSLDINENRGHENNIATPTNQRPNLRTV